MLVQAALCGVSVCGRPVNGGGYQCSMRCVALLYQRPEAFCFSAGANGLVSKLISGAVINIVVGQRSDEVKKEYELMRVPSGYGPIAIGGVAYAGYLLVEFLTCLSTTC